ncbi:e ubiquitin protein ligase march [Trichuris trichiura]|uniref:E ubiquitin protein ligase march n=1 Tax=Trichuris trichiura TaxID=36087 RepID=A0A077Z828_TRITR|nr:e ubiquitin protein ligase march [Trichuris trichiura]
MQDSEIQPLKVLELESELPVLSSSRESDSFNKSTDGTKNGESTVLNMDTYDGTEENKHGALRSDSIRSASSTSVCSLQQLCRICHLPASRGKALVSPCRCLGTLRFVHKACLVHWLEVSSRKLASSPQCELCGYQYKTHHCFTFRRAEVPRCTRQDRVLHLLFLSMAFVMTCSAFISILYLSQDSNTRMRNLLNRQDITVISCSLLFFVAFFVALFTQYRADTSLCCLFARCWIINRHWRVKDYDVTPESHPLK